MIIEYDEHIKTIAQELTRFAMSINKDDAAKRYLDLSERRTGILKSQIQDIVEEHIENDPVFFNKLLPVSIYSNDDKDMKNKLGVITFIVIETNDSFIRMYPIHLEQFTPEPFENFIFYERNLILKYKCLYREQSHIVIPVDMRFVYLV